MRQRINKKNKKRKGEVIKADIRMNSQVEFHPDVRKLFQTTKAIYRALDTAEDQLKRVLDENEKLQTENSRLKKLLKR